MTCWPNYSDRGSYSFYMGEAEYWSHAAIDTDDNYDVQH